MQEELIKQMESHGVRATAVRLLILRTLFEAERPLSSLDIERRLDTVDRSSITRAISIFLEKGILHNIDDGTGATKYEPCRAHSHSHDDLHPHFHCRSCGQTYCLEEQRVPIIDLPEGFTVHQVNYVIAGCCRNCNESTPN